MNQKIQAKNVREPFGKGNGHRVAHYLPPCNFICEHLGISPADLEGSGRVNVSKRFLRVLLGEIARSFEFDETWYAQTYPDVEGARIAGDIKSASEHFFKSGYIEGRLPRRLPFDANWYRSHYADISEAFPSGSPDALREHFMTRGYFEGRAGTPEMLAEVERWHALAKEE